LAVSLLASATPLRAQEAAAKNADETLQFMNEEMALITVASKKPESVFNSVSNVTVITREMIDNYNFASVGDALQTLADVQIGRSYVLKDVVTFRGVLQEHYTNKILIMID